jgi:glutamyl-tRNA synthetase
VLNRSGQRLAKRDGAISLADLAATGLEPGQVLGLLATSLGLAEPGEPVSPSLLLARFEPTAVPLMPWVVDPRAYAAATNRMSTT